MDQISRVESQIFLAGEKIQEKSLKMDFAENENSLRFVKLVFGVLHFYNHVPNP